MYGSEGRFERRRERGGKRLSSNCSLSKLRGPGKKNEKLRTENWELYMGRGLPVGRSLSQKKGGGGCDEKTFG